MASIKDVARLAGVSTSTVSRVLGHPETVSEELRTRVQQTIAELGYRPNLAARRLRQQRASVIGLIVADIRNPFFTDISRAVEDVAYAHGLRVILCNSDEDPAKERAYLELMADEQASGIILAPTAEYVRAADRTPGAAALDLPLVLVDRAPTPSRTDCVLLDNTGAARQLTQHLVDQGWRHIALLAGAHSSTGRERRAGYEQVMQEQGLAPRVETAPPSVAAGEQALRRLLAQAPRLDAVLATNGLLLLGAQQALLAAGLESPRDVALAGFDNNDWTALQRPAVTVIAQPTYEIGRSAAELLLQRMQTPERSTRRIVLPGELLIRGSTTRPLAAA
ncbi:MAG: HTH-type transcriptional regulator KdgR [Paracidovorax wautersii]|uniref:HTH-type transcriptional regulator KdgR n=1 Tax=Paracidovorax wautersii TaxID=1177982 RepID=A0A7V8JQE2_9BURK|nr:MAG: HTH-type transcriptional regulator KdgR [Paracidovorax wautersii]